MRFNLAGFRTVLTEQVRIEIGFSAQINARLELSDIQEEVLVTGASPIVDVKSTSLGGRFDANALEVLPSVRDPFAMFAQVPGAAVSRQNVGGNLSGSNNVIIARGAPTSQAKTFVAPSDRAFIAM